MKKRFAAAAAVLMLAAAGCAAEGMVVDGRNADRVHLRAAPSLSADSLGLYFTGTPLEVLGGEESGFLPVCIGAAEGYIKADLTAQAEDVLPAISAGEVWADADEQGCTPLYAEPDHNAETVGDLQGLQRVLVLGQTKNGFYDVTAGSGARGYIAQGDLRLMDAVRPEASEAMQEVSIISCGEKTTVRLEQAGFALDRYGSCVHEIELERDSETVQRLYYICETVPQTAPHLDFADMNMDGYPDLIALRTMGASDAYAVYFLYEPETGLYERCLALEGFSAWRYELVPSDRIIINNIRINAGEVCQEIYQWQENELILLEIKRE